MKFRSQSGIAIGPILFVVAILAILAAAIAAGSGSFTGGTSTENAKLMAQHIIQSCHQYQDAVQLMTLQIAAILPSLITRLTADGLLGQAPGIRATTPLVTAPTSLATEPARYTRRTAAG